jgi:hypothetical protein
MPNKMFSNFSEVQYTLGTGKIVTIKDFFKKASVEQESLWGVVDYTFYQLEDGERPDIVANKLYGDSDLHWTLFLVNDFATYGDWHKDSVTLENHMLNKYKGQWLNADLVSDLMTSSTNKLLIGEEIYETSNTNVTGNITDVDLTRKRISVVGDVFSANSITSKTSGTEISNIFTNRTFTPSSVVNKRDGVHHWVVTDSTGLEYKVHNEPTTELTSNPPTAVAVTYQDHEYNLNEEKRSIKIIRPAVINQVVTEFEELMRN